MIFLLAIALNPIKLPLLFDWYSIAIIPVKISASKSHSFSSLILQLTQHYFSQSTHLIYQSILPLFTQSHSASSILSPTQSISISLNFPSKMPQVPKFYSFEPRSNYFNFKIHRHRHTHQTSSLDFWTHSRPLHMILVSSNKPPFLPSVIEFHSILRKQLLWSKRFALI